VEPLSTGRSLPELAGDTVIRTERFILRPLTESDASERYLQWLSDADAQRYIYSAAATRSFEDLRQYIAERAGRDDVLFLGIFESLTGLHIGNIKYEPLDPAARFAVMGILIGDPAYRGRGVTAEVLTASAQWLRDRHGIEEIVLGVDAENTPAIRAYERIGFVRMATPHIPTPAPGTFTMCWRLDDMGAHMEELIAELYPLNRTIASADGAAVMQAISSRYDVEVLEYPTGAEYQTWVVPPEWDVVRASLHEGDELVADYDECRLFVAPYSLPFSGLVSRDELVEHTFTNPAAPDAFCYEFRLAYNFARRLKEWRIALPHERVDRLGPGPFRVDIEVRSRPGVMRIAEAVHAGSSGSWFYLLAHYCHAAQANDGIAGVAVMFEALERIRRRHPRPLHGYRVLAMPETIGSSVYAATHEAELDASLGAVFSEMPGADAPLQLVRSRRGDTYIDRVFSHVLKLQGRRVGRTVPFRGGWGNDELVFDAPGVGVPAVSLDRYPYAQYHTHFDDTSRVSPDRLEEVVEVLLGVVDVLEQDYIPRPRQRVPVYLSRYGLYADWTQARARYDLNAVVIDAMWSGASVLDIALQHGLPPAVVSDYVNRFADLGLVDRTPVTPEYVRAVRFADAAGDHSTRQGDAG
jgi:aminopeptidase-like protein/RimJ/RimL family protein N-acetyltransferase